MVKEKKKCFKSKYRPTSMLLDVNVIIYFKLILHLKFRNNKCYFSIFVNFCTSVL